MYTENTSRFKTPVPASVLAPVKLEPAGAKKWTQPEVD
jgi:hypothetical protein